MKKVYSRLLSFGLAVLVAFGMLIVPASEPVHADAGYYWGTVKYAKNITLYKISDYPDLYTINMGKKFKGASSVKIKSSKKSVLEDYGWSKGETEFYVQANKTGKSTLSIKVKKSGKTKTYKIKVKVVKGSNPFKSFKIGKKKVTSKFKKSPYVELNLAKNKKYKLAIKLKSGMKLKKIKSSVWNEETEKTVNKTLKNNKSFKLTKDDTTLEIRVYDKKSKITFTYWLYI